MNELRHQLLKRLRNRRKNKDSFMVCFSGTPLSGKSTLAKLIQSRYEMVRVENDTIRQIIEDRNFDSDAYEVLHDFLDDYDQPNRRIVLDSSIDRNYRDILSLCEDRNFPVFIIRLPIPDDFDSRAIEREGVKFDTWSSKPKQKFIEEHRSAADNLEFDFEVGKDGGFVRLLQKLDTQLFK